MKIHCTYHSIKRAKTRLGWNPEILEQKANEAMGLNNGINPNLSKTAKIRLIKLLFDVDKKIKIMDNNLFVFRKAPDSWFLVTVFDISPFISKDIYVSNHSNHIYFRNANKMAKQKALQRAKEKSE